MKSKFYSQNGSIRLWYILLIQFLWFGKAAMNTANKKSWKMGYSLHFSNNWYRKRWGMNSTKRMRFHYYFIAERRIFQDMTFLPWLWFLIFLYGSGNPFWIEEGKNLAFIQNQVFTLRVTDIKCLLSFVLFITTSVPISGIYWRSILSDISTNWRVFT